MPHLAKSGYQHPDLRPVIGTKGLKTFHIAVDDDNDNILDEAACGTELDSRAWPAGTMTKRAALRRGLTLCPKCAELEDEELEELEELEEASE